LSIVVIQGASQNLTNQRISPQVSETGEDNTNIAEQARHRIIVSPEQATAVATYY